MKNFRKNTERGKEPGKDTYKKRGKHAYGNLHSTVSVPKTYGLGTKNVRFWDETSETKKYNTFRIGNNI